VLPLRVGARLASIGARLTGVVLHHAGTPAATATPAPPPEVAASRSAPVLSLLSGAANPVTLAWTSGSEVPAGYTLLVGSQPAARDLGVLPMGRATGVTAPAPWGTPLYVRVVAHGSRGDAESNEVLVMVSGRHASPPTLAPPVVRGRTVTLTWTALSPRVLVQARQSPTGPVIAASAPISGDALTVANVPPGTYYVSVADAAGAVSNTVTLIVR
jgi:hypothetical protein